MYNIQNNDILNNSHIDVNVHKVKVLNFVKKKEEKKLPAIKILLCNTTVQGKKTKISELNPHIKELEEAKAIINNNNILSLTEKGRKLLAENQHLLKRKKIELNSKKTYCNKGIPTKEDMAIMEHVKNLIANNKISELKTTIIAKKLGITHQLVSRRLKRLKDAGHIYYIPRRMDSMRIIKDIN